MENHREHLIRLVTGEADESERERMLARLEQDPALRDEFERLQAVAAVVSVVEAPRFEPFFAGRVLHRIRRERARSGSMYESLRWIFARVALASLAACLGLGVYNTVIASNAEIGSSALESALGVPAENLGTVYLLASE